MSFDASLVLDQLTQSSNGANRLVCMIGAKNFIRSDSENWVSFRFPQKSANKSNYIKIKLENDLYTVEFGYIRGGKYTVRSTESGLYDTMLKGYFEDKTKLYLSL